MMVEDKMLDERGGRLSERCRESRYKGTCAQPLYAATKIRIVSLKRCARVLLYTLTLHRCITSFVKYEADF